MTARAGTDERRRQQTLATVEALRAGGAALPMDAIAEAIGTTKPALYRLFGSKQGLYDAVAAWFIDDLLRQVLDVADPSMPLEDFVADAMRLIIERVHADRAVYDFLMRRSRMALSPADQGGGDYLRSLGDRVALLIAVRLQAVGADPAPAPVLAHGVVGLINGVADWSLEHPEVSPAQAASVAATLLGSGLRPFSDRGR